VWADRTTPTYAPVSGERRANVVVVGAGLCGLFTATLLVRAGRDVLVVDRHDVGGVATRNTTAKISALQGTTYRTIASARGHEVAADYAAAQLDAVAGIRALIDELGIDCALTEAPAYTYGTEPQTEAQLREEYDAASSAGLPVHWDDDTELPFPVVGAVRLDGQLHFDPEACCDAIARWLGDERVATHSAVMGVEESSDGCRVDIEGGAVVRAEHVVLATQAPIVDPGLLTNRCAPSQSYAVAARLAGDVPAGMYLSCDEAVRSLRPAVHDGAPIAVIGGEGHPMGAPEATTERWATLERWTARHFGAAEVTHRWATHDLVPTDRVPFIGRLGPRSHRRWVATGLAKWGMTNSYVAAKLISEELDGRRVPWSNAFDSTRIASSVNRELLSAGRNAATHLLVDRITRRPEPRCTHQGCVLREDRALGTWDCPCHGSRFDADGQVIQGPATAPLDLD
jgi:glycine/D-amino acid oxidase-like deaminating enzyme